MAEASAPALVRPQVGPQERFLASPADIAIYGGAAGGGKTWALLMEPLRHTKNPHFGAVFLRRTTPQIRNKGGLWDASARLYPDIGATPREHTLDWTFPSGATVSFSHLQHDNTVLDYQGSEIPLLCFDELTHFSAAQFWYMVSRNRSTCGVRPYIRATCNPDPDSWVRQFIAWWIDEISGLPIMERAGLVRWFVRVNDELIWADTPGDLEGYTVPDADGVQQPIPPKSVTFVPAQLTDNTALMRADPGYMANLMSLPEVERGRLLAGNWNVRNTAARVFRNWRSMDFDTPEDAILRFGADWGFSIDPTTLVRMFIGKLVDGVPVADPTGRTLFIDHEAYKIGCEIDETPALFAGTCPADRPLEHRWDNPHKHPGVPGATRWLITADSARPETVSYMKRKGFRIGAAIKGAGSLEDGIEFLRTFDIVVHPRCVHTIEELTLYSWKTDPLTGEILPVLADKDNHLIDAARYGLEAVRRVKRMPTKPAREERTDYKAKRQADSGWVTS